MAFMILEGMEEYVNLSGSITYYIHLLLYYILHTFIIILHITYIYYYITYYIHLLLYYILHTFIIILHITYIYYYITYYIHLLLYYILHTFIIILHITYIYYYITYYIHLSGAVIVAQGGDGIYDTRGDGRICELIR